MLKLFSIFTESAPRFAVFLPLQNTLLLETSGQRPYRENWAAMTNLKKNSFLHLKTFAFVQLLLGFWSPTTVDKGELATG